MSFWLKVFIRISLRLGNWAFGILQTVGGIATLLWETLFFIFRPPYRVRETFRQMKVIGLETTPLIIVVLAFVGSVVMMELRYQLMRLIHTVEWVPGFAAIFLLREAATAVVGAMVASRAGAGMAAEVGSMQITEQVDALRLLRANPVHYLVVPRFMAGIVMMEVLAMIGVVTGLTFSYLFCMDVHNPMSFIDMVRRFTDSWDLVVVFKKAFFFGMAVPIISCYYGFEAKGGAQGVGIATTKAVVYSILTVIILDFILTGSEKLVG